MALTPEEIKKIAEEIDKIREEKDLPVFSDDDLKRAQSLLKALKDANSSCLVSAPDSDINRHVVMPLKL